MTNGNQPWGHGHPSAEELASFVDGGLRATERQRVAHHLADCPDCHQLLTETVQLLRDPALAGAEAASPELDDDDDDSFQRLGNFPPPVANRRLRTPSPAIVLMAAALLALLIWTAADRWFLAFPSHSTEIADLTRPLVERHSSLDLGIGKEGWPTSMGGGTSLTAAQEAAVRRGVRICQLDGALAAAQERDAKGVAAELRKELEGAELSNLTLYLEKILEGLRREQPGDELLSLTSQIDSVLGDFHARGDEADADLYLLGKWACAAGIASRAGDLSWFTEAASRSTLRRLRRADLPGSILPAFETLEGRAGSGVQERDLEAIAEASRQLIHVAGGGAPQL